MIKFDKNNERQALVRHGHGLRLIELENKKNIDPGHAYLVSNLLQLPFNVYFLDVNSTNLQCNDTCAESCGFLSVNDAMGRSSKDVFGKQSAKMVLENDRFVLSNNTAYIADEMLEKIDNVTVTVFDFKFPLYGEKNRMMGIFGFSFFLGKHPLRETLSVIFRMGLLSSSVPLSIFPGTFIEEVYLTRREAQIANHLIRGKTARNISQIMFVSPRTVEKHIDNIKIKMKTNRKSELIEKLIHYGSGTLVR